MVTYPEHELGVWFAPFGATIPDKFGWLIAKSPERGANFLNNPGIELGISGWSV